ncbi:unnamed protein product [Dicrocoelium dendriticum]|nr:unnamed protein product [Dicrocoelium dendriticum]
MGIASVVLCLVITIHALLVLGAHANCIWYGIGDKSDPVRPKYSSYDGPAKPLDNETAYTTLKKLCPNYAQSHNPSLCCDGEQVAFFSASAVAAQDLLKRCPACWANFRLLLCAMTCDPNQAEFLTPNIDKSVVSSIVYNVSSTVANTFFNSCKDVQFAGAHAIDPICASTSCTPEKLLGGIGSQSPFPVNFVITPNPANPTSNTGGKQPFNQTFYPCNESVPRRGSDTGGPACSCLDCESSCVAPPEPPAPQPPPQVFGFDAWWVGAFFTFVAVVLVFAACEINSRLRDRQSAAGVIDDRRGLLEDDSSEVTDELDAVESAPPRRPNCLVRLQAKLEDMLCQVFTWLGRLVARHPYITLLISLSISIALAAGLSMFTVTTNPVELWSPPTSRSRLEKSYFDTNFAPFFRTEQIIIRPRNQSNFVHRSLFPLPGKMLVGPALRKSFLDEVLKLQKMLQHFSVYSKEFGKNISLEDICFKPLAPDNLECGIQSPLEYFQSDSATFNQTLLSFGIVVADYLDHLLFCANSPVSTGGSYPNKTVSCLGSSSMPILPAVVFGAFNGEPLQQFCNAAYLFTSRTWQSFVLTTGQLCFLFICQLHRFILHTTYLFITF